MRKFILIALLLATPALAIPDVSCPTRPAGDSSNACATTQFVATLCSAAGGNFTTVTVSQGVLVSGVAIASLPTCDATKLGMLYTVSNGTAYGTGTYGSAVSATGTVTRLVICTNTAAPTTYAWAYN